MKYAISGASKNLARLITRACAGKEVVIACKGLQVKLIPVRELKAARKDRIPGRLKGKIFCAPDAFEPLTSRELSSSGSNDRIGSPFAAGKHPIAANPKPFYGLR